MSKIGVFGGSFNPVHNGHIVMGLRALEAADLDRMIVIPAAIPPHKQDAELLPSELRLRCLEAAFRDLDGFEIDTRELERGDVSYTVDTLEELRQENADAELFFVVGGDSVPNLPDWRNVERLAELATFLWIPRPGFHDSVATATRAAIPGLRLEKVPCPLLEISASEVRARLSAELSVRGWVPEGVEALLVG